jgi:hypothetical protein
VIGDWALDFCSLVITIDYMKILMDADCLIKLTKGGLKESICQKEEIVIPHVVKREVVDAGKRKGLPDADAVEKNINSGLIGLAEEASPSHLKGEQALIASFGRGGYGVIATDDGKFIRILRAAGIPFILPGLLIFLLYKKGEIDRMTGLKWLERLSPFISDDEYSMTRLLLEGKS